MPKQTFFIIMKDHNGRLLTADGTEIPTYDKKRVGAVLKQLRDAGQSPEEPDLFLLELGMGTKLTGAILNEDEIGTDEADVTINMRGA